MQLGEAPAHAIVRSQGKRHLRYWKLSALSNSHEYLFEPRSRAKLNVAQRHIAQMEWPNIPVDGVRRRRRRRAGRHFADRHELPSTTGDGPSGEVRRNRDSFPA